MTGSKLSYSSLPVRVRFSELGGEAEVLILVYVAEVVGGGGDDVAQGDVGVAALGEAGAGGVGVAGVAGGERGEGIGELALDVVEVVVGDAELGFQIVGEFPVDAELGAGEPFVGALEFAGWLEAKLKSVL